MEIDFRPRLDIVTQLLRTVETQALQGANCTPGTDLNLGDRVVNRFAQVKESPLKNIRNMTNIFFKIDTFFKNIKIVFIIENVLISIKNNYLNNNFCLVKERFQDAAIVAVNSANWLTR